MNFVIDKINITLRFTSGLLLAAAFGLSNSAAIESTAQADGTPAVQKLVRGGVSIEFQATPDYTGVIREGRYADIEFRISDAESGEPVKGIYPAVWLDIAGIGEQTDGEPIMSCKDRVQLYMQGVVGVRPLVDLNSYFILVMNNDATITVIDPIVGISGITKL